MLPAADSNITSIKSDRLKALDQAAAGALSDAVAAGGFEGKQVTSQQFESWYGSEPS